jgi:signal transduction histidine kinase
VVLVAQVLLAALACTVLRAAARDTDRLLATSAAERAAGTARSAVRADEREQQRRLHDTVLSTLTMVHSGPSDTDLAVLRRRAAEDLVVLRDWPDRQTRLDVLLSRLAAGVPLRVTVRAPAVELPVPVVSALAGAAQEALGNAARHSGADTVHVLLRRHARGVSVEIRDGGAGFDPAQVPASRRGLRESITGRLRDVGGDARIDAAPGRGTAIILRWPA